jgi:hypothetical protein
VYGSPFDKLRMSAAPLPRDSSVAALLQNDRTGKYYNVIPGLTRNPGSLTCHSECSEESARGKGVYWIPAAVYPSVRKGWNDI